MAKGKQTKLPKKIAGVKIPKPLRKAGGAAVEWAQGPVVSEIVAAAMVAAAASLTADRKTVRTAARDAEGFASDAMKQGAAIGHAVKKAMIDAARDLLDAYDEPDAGDRKPPAKAAVRKPASGG